MKFITSAIRTLLLWTARLPPSGWVIGSIFEHMPFILRSAYLLENSKFVAFKHPVPIEAAHTLIIPKLAKKSSIDFLSDSKNVMGVSCFAKEAAKKLNLKAFSINTNSGTRQEVKQIHFHLLATKEPFERSIKIPESESKLGDGLLKLIRSSPELQTLEICYESHINETSLHETFANALSDLSSSISSARGATTSFYFTTKNGEATLHPTLRIVMDTL